MEGSVRGLTEVPMSEKTKGKSGALESEGGKQDGSYGKGFCLWE